MVDHFTVIHFALNLNVKGRCMLSTQTNGELRLGKFFHRFPLVIPKLVLLGAFGLLSVVVPVHSWAGGLYITEFGTLSTGVASAGAVAVAHDASTAWHNPVWSVNQALSHY